MNAVEIEQAISELALQPFDATEFPFTFLAAFGNKDTTLKRLRTGNNNASDVHALLELLPRAPRALHILRQEGVLHLGNRPLYHLVFFSRHELPNRIWSDVAQGPNREFDF